MAIETSPDDASRVDDLMRQFHEFLAKKQLKSTRQRDAIARTFFASVDHVSIEDLLGRSRDVNPRIGYATVYRTLKLLSECGLAALRRFGDGQTVYETAGDDAHHDHLVCLDCGKVEEFYDAEIEKRQQAVARAKGFTIADHALSLYAYCTKADCPHRPPAGR